jgi:hypothetical protein
MSAIKAIGEALSYDAVEAAIMTPGALYSGRVLDLANRIYDMAAESSDDAPVSLRATELSTVRPCKAA